MGMHIGKGTVLPKLYITWPHQVSIGDNCVLEHGTSIKYDDIWKPGPSITIGNNVYIGSFCEFNITMAIEIGNNSLIASGCRFIDHDHGSLRGQLIRTQICSAKRIKIGEDVWLGCNVIVLKGVEIGNGAIVAAGAVVTKSISSNEIWAGVPAKKIRDRV
jgi:acetyltransferase-like isoleucine patch superfamily enzyme